MLIDGVTNADALPALERMMQFAGARHRIIVNNIANLDTPGYLTKDVSVEDFQAQLAEAIDAKREGKNKKDSDGESASGSNSVRTLQLNDSEEVQFKDNGIVLNPKPTNENILFHDGNDRDLERTMQDLVENFTVFRTAAQLLRNRFELINTAIRERM